jgi:hypothetical protein
VQGARDELLAGAGLPRHQHRGICRCIQRDLLAHCARRAAAADECRPAARGAHARCRLRVLCPGAYCVGAAHVACDVQRRTERRADRFRRIQQDARDAGLLRHVDHQTGADDRAHAAAHQLCHTRACILGGDERAMLDRQAKSATEFGKGRHLALVRDHADTLGQWLSACQGLHQVEAAGSHHHHWLLEAVAQVGAVRARGDDDVAGLRPGSATDVANGILETEVDDLDARAVVELGRQVANQRGQPRNRHRPDHRQTRRIIAERVQRGERTSRHGRMS